MRVVILRFSKLTGVGYYVAGTGCLFVIIVIRGNIFIGLRNSSVEDIKYVLSKGVEREYPGYREVFTKDELLKELVEISSRKWVIITSHIMFREKEDEIFRILSNFFKNIRRWRASKYILIADAINMPGLPLEIIIREQGEEPVLISIPINKDKEIEIARAPFIIEDNKWVHPATIVGLFPP